jgi:predicted Zn-dependent protease
MELSKTSEEWTMKKSIAFLIALSLIGCASTNKSRYREGDNTGQVTTVTVQDEQRMTEEVLPKMKKDYPPTGNPELQQYVSTLGIAIVKANNLEGNPYNYDFTVVDVSQVNAFALPAGKVFVTAPLIAMATDEAELAGVIGHEIGHVVARHAAERMFAMEKKKTWLYAAGGGLVGAAAGLALGALVCPDGDGSCLAGAAAIGGAAGVGGGLLVQKYQFLANSREDEMEADRIGFKMAVGAGYDKDHVGKFYEKLLQSEKNAKKSGNPVMRSLMDAISTHPPSEERVMQMDEMASNAPAITNAIISSPDFTRSKRIAAGLHKK